MKQIITHPNYYITPCGKVWNNIKQKYLKQSKDTQGYLHVRLSNNGITKTIKVHKLIAIYYLNQTDNKLIVDHIDNNKLNNTVENLQLISQRLNSSKDRKNKTSIYTGVHWSKKDNKWYASIRINKKKKNLGLFNTELEAHNEYQLELHKTY